MGALASALLGAGEGVAAGAAVLDGASPLLGALFGDAFDGVTFVGPESVLITSGAVGGRPGSGTPVGAGAIALDGSIVLEVPDGFGGELDAHTGDGTIAIHDITLSNVTGQISKSTVRGRLGAGGHAVRMRTGDGSITVRRS